MYAWAGTDTSSELVVAHMQIDKAATEPKEEEMEEEELVALEESMCV